MKQVLERTRQLAELAARLDTVRAGGGRAVLVTGEAGIGKTTLLRAFRAGAGDVRFLRGACDPLFTPRPLGAIHDVAEEAGGELRDLAAGGAMPSELAAGL